MHHGCYHLCPKVREQLRKAQLQEERGSPSDYELRDVAGPSKLQQAEDTSKRSKESRKLPPRAPSPTKIVRSPSRSHESAYRQNEQYASSRGSPTKRSKESQRTKEDPSRQESPIWSPEASGRFDPDKRSAGRSKESQRTDASVRFGPDPKSHPRSQESDQKSSRSIRQEKSVPDRDKSPQFSATLKSQRKPRAVDDGAGPSGKRRGVKGDADGFEDFEESYSAHDLCDSHCRGINERMRKFRDERQQQEMDEYLVYKGMPYFGDLCTCCYQCLVKQLWNDHFVNTTITSAALFAVGLKLCSDLNGWTLPNVF